MSLQIFTKPKCQESRKAERYFKERRIPYQLCDLSRRALSRREYEAIRQAAPERRKFRMRALQAGPLLTIVAENGYSGERRRDGNGFLSTKRPGRGVGLASMA